MNIKTSAVAGTLESSDVYVKVEPCERLEIEIESVVYNQFAQQIEQSVREVTRELGVESGKISVNDKGAIDCVIKARVETAIKRAGGKTDEKIDVVYSGKHPEPADERRRSGR